MKKQDEPPVIGQISCDVKDFSGHLVLHQQVITGEYERGRRKITFNVSTTIPDGSIVLNIENGKGHYLVSMKDIVEKLTEFYEQRHGKKKEIVVMPTTPAKK